jgi:hypothetical protein
VTHDHILAPKKISVLSFVGRPPSGGERDCHVQGSQSLSMSCVYSCVYVYPVLILLLLLFTMLYVHARPVNLGITQQIMSTLYTACGRETGGYKTTRRLSCLKRRNYKKIGAVVAQLV